MEMRISLPGGARVDAAYKGFVISTDQPARLGGTNAAPAPFDYFLASLGTCAGFYVLSFLERRDLSTQDVALTLSTVKDPESHMLSQITIKVILPESFPEKYRKAIVNAVNQCSVKKHLLEPPRFNTVVEIGEREAA
jgi:ribosomal protein S12 methylthiotransferase accessory factor